MGTKKDRKGRGWLSSIDTKPEAVRVFVNSALRENRLQQTEILEQANAMLEELGDSPITSSSLNRYSLSVEEDGAMMREAREAARTLVGGLAEQGESDLGRTITEMVKTLTWNLIARRRRDDDDDGDGEPIDLDALNKLALITQRIERASKISVEREIKIREEAEAQALKKAAKAAGESAEQAGVSPETVQAIRRDVLRMAG